MACASGHPSSAPDLPATPQAPEATRAPSGAGTIRVEVVRADGPHRVVRRCIELPHGATAADALRASGLVAEAGAQRLDGLALGCWGRPCDPGTPLRDHDRVELTRPLRIDPKEARRLRYRRDGLKRKTPPARR